MCKYSKDVIKLEIEWDDDLDEHERSLSYTVYAENNQGCGHEYVFDNEKMANEFAEACQRSGVFELVMLTKQETKTTQWSYHNVKDLYYLHNGVKYYHE